MNTLNKFIKNEQGGANAIVGVVVIILSMYLIMLTVEIGRLYFLVYKYQNDLDFANGATWSELDLKHLAYGEYQFHNDSETETEGYARAYQKFHTYLSENLGLDVSLVPLPEHPTIAAPVTVETFEVNLESDIPFTNSDGIYIDKISIYSKISVPIKLIFPYFGEPYHAVIKKVTNVEDDL